LYDDTTFFSYDPFLYQVSKHRSRLFSMEQDGTFLHQRDIRYDFAPSCVLDLLVPRSLAQGHHESLPVLVCTHGGGWVLNRKESMVQLARTIMSLQDQEYTGRGRWVGHSRPSSPPFCIVVPSYRLSSFNNSVLNKLLAFEFLSCSALACLFPSILPLVVLALLVMVLCIVVFAMVHLRVAVRHPVHVEDLACVMKWVGRNAGVHSMDPSRTVLLGHSAGAHLVTLLATNNAFLRRFGVNPSTIRGVVALSGVYSDKRLQEVPGGQEILDNVFGASGKHYRDCFPIYHCLPTSPPHLVCVSELDFWLKKHALDYVYALQQQGVYVESVMAPKNNHFSVHKKWESDNFFMYKKTTGFCRQCIALELSPPAD